MTTMIFGNIPKFDEITESISTLEKRINTVQKK
jgi:hypothetical protein